MSADKLAAQPSGAQSPKIPQSPATTLGKSAIGLVNLDYYLPLWAKYEASHQVGAVWNWSAALYTLNWMVFRGLRKPGQIYLGTLLCAVAMFLFARLAVPMSETSQGLVAGLMVLVSIFVPGLYGNAWFLADIQKRIIASVEASSTMVEANLKLKQSASTRQGFIRMLQINAGLAVALVTVGAALVLTDVLPAGDAANASAAKPLNASTVPMVTIKSNAGPVALGPSLAASELASASPPSLQVSAIQPSASSPVVETQPLPAPCSDCSANTKASGEAGESLKKSMTLTKPESKTPKQPMRGTEQQSVAIKLQNQGGKTALSDRPKMEGRHHFINVGLFAKPGNAEATYSQLVEAGFPALKQEITTTHGKRFRVRAGPFETLAQAEEGAVKIRLLNLEAKVVTRQ